MQMAVWSERSPMQTARSSPACRSPFNLERDDSNPKKIPSQQAAVNPTATDMYDAGATE